MRLVREEEGDVDGQVRDDHDDLDAVLADVDVVDDAAALQRDADLVALTPARDRLRRRLGVVHVLGHVLQRNDSDFAFDTAPLGEPF